MGNLSEIKPIGLLAMVEKAPFYDGRETFFYWDNVVPLREGDILQLDTAKKLYTENQVNMIIDELEKKIANAGTYSANNEGLIYQGIKSAFKEIRAIMEDNKNE